MARTTKKAESESPAEEVKETKKESVILPISLDFHKEDLNTLVSKVNEIITFLNK